MAEPASALKKLRQGANILGRLSLSASTLKHLDEQTLAGLLAIAHAIDEHELGGTDFGGWGVLAAPRFLGRTALLHALQRYAAEGAWGISPHIIPHHTLHSVPGTVSMALQIHGPNFGIDGGAGAVAQMVLAAASMLADGRLPGLWLLATGWSPEPDPAPMGHTASTGPDPICLAVALALVPDRVGRSPLALLVRWGNDPVVPPAPGFLKSLSLEALHAAFASPSGPAVPITWRLLGDSTVEMVPAAACAESHR